MDRLETTHTNTDQGARRIAAIAESMNIIRTLNSLRKTFTVRYAKNFIKFTAIDSEVDLNNRVRPSTGLWMQDGHEVYLFLRW